MKIAIVTTYFTEGMGYSENCLSKSLAQLGHEVHVITSEFNIYGSSSIYKKTYESFLGPAKVPAGKYNSEFYTIHRLKGSMIKGYVYINGLSSKLREIAPDIVHSLEIASIQTFKLALLKPFFKFKLFTETHQHLSVMKPYLLTNKRHFILKKINYFITRKIPSFLSSFAVDKCYAISPDCGFVANKFYGIPNFKISIQPLGTDTNLFYPATTENDIFNRNKLRELYGYAEDDIVCIYTGRFSDDKNPLILAMAIDKLASQDKKFKGIFIGDGLQEISIKNCSNVNILPFRKYVELAELYRMSDIAVWPTQESMSMLDACASALPLIVSDKIGEMDRIDGNGLLFKHNDIDDLIRCVYSLASYDKRNKMGNMGREKMINNYSWQKIALNYVQDYQKYC